WKRVFEGQFQGYTVIMESNPESVLLLSIVEFNDQNAPVGAVIQSYKMFYCEGDTEHFVTTLPREVIVLYKHGENLNQKFLLLAGKPNYVTWKEKDFSEETDAQLKRMKISTDLLHDISKAYDLKLTEIENTDKDTRNAFFAEPLIVPITATSLFGSGAPAPYVKEMPVSSLGEKDIRLGLTKEGKKVSESYSLLRKTIVNGGDPRLRHHALHILTEGFLLNNVDVVVFDWMDSFGSIHNPNPDTAELAKARVETEPIGFPVKKFVSRKDLFCEPERVNPATFLEIVGAGENKSSALLVKLWEQKKPSKLTELLKAIEGVTKTEELSEFEIRRARRMLQTIMAEFGELFEGKNNLDDLTKSWIKGLGKASLLGLKGLSPREQELVLYGVLKSMEYDFRLKGKTNSPRAMLLVPNASRIFPRQNASRAQTEMAGILKDLPPFGAGFLLEETEPNALETGLSTEAEATLTLVSELDTAVNLKDKKNYRTILRPGLSQING
ncbi:MAG: hypothetical protein HY917_03640, partial [Candidatus Diapherotrites archaeon]|nr:hypothetical protein [Candidatus Diapherotrites archaeon]